MMNTLGLTEQEKIALKIIEKAFESNNLDFAKISLDRRSSSYLSLLTKEEWEPGADFCRLKAGVKSVWISLDTWCCPKEFTSSDRFSNVVNKNQRHWKIDLPSLNSIAEICDLIIDVYLYSIGESPLKNALQTPDLTEESTSNSQSTYRKKGHRLTTLPQDYVVIDLETTGLDTRFCEIIELSAVLVRNDEIADIFHSLVKPVEKVGEFVESLTGITNEMLTNAPSVDAALPEFLRFVGDNIVIGHNVNFDINFIYDDKMKIDGNPFRNDYVDTLQIARKALPQLSHHRLKDIAEYLSFDFATQHRATEDCMMTYQCYLKLKDIVIENGIDLTSLKKDHNKIKAKNVLAATENFDENHLLFGKVCVFTGKLEKMDRAKAMQIVANIGGINADNVTKKTNYLILGNNDFCSSLKGGKSSKQKKAEKLALEGQDIQIISENVFYEMISESQG